MTENWREHGQPFLSFNEEITQQWIDKGFSKRKCQEWLGVGLKANDANFCYWLVNVVEINSEDYINASVEDEENLKEQYQEYLDSQKISADFNLESFKEKIKKTKLLSKELKKAKKYLENSQNNPFSPLSEQEVKDLEKELSDNAITSEEKENFKRGIEKEKNQNNLLLNNSNFSEVYNNKGKYPYLYFFVKELNTFALIDFDWTNELLKKFKKLYPSRTLNENSDWLGVAQHIKEKFLNKEIGFYFDKYFPNINKEEVKKVLSDFVASAEATANNDERYYLLPKLDKNKPFAEVLPREKAIFGLKQNE